MHRGILCHSKVFYDLIIHARKSHHAVKLKLALIDGYYSQARPWIVKLMGRTFLSGKILLNKLYEVGS